MRDLEFDAAELPIVTFLLAEAFGKPLVLLPAVVLVPVIADRWRPRARGGNSTRRSRSTTW